MIKKFFKDSFIYTLPTILSRGLSIFLVPLYTRILNPSDYGVLDLLAVFGSLITLTIALEISQALARFYNSEKNEQEKKSLSSTALWFTIIMYTLFLIFGQIFAKELAILIIKEEGFSNIFRLALFKIYSNGILLLVQGQFRWELKSKNYSTTSIIVITSTAGFSILFGYGLQLGLAGFLIGAICASICGLSYSFYYLRTSFSLTLSTSKLRYMLGYSAPLVLASIAVFVSHFIDRVMINHYLNLTDLGLYSLGYKIASLVSLIVSGFSISLTPLIFKHYMEPETPNNMVKIFNTFVLFAGLLVLGLSLFSKEALFILSTAEFYPASKVVIYLAPAVLLSKMHIFSPGLSIAKKTTYIIWINVVGAIIHILLNWLFIPRYGYVGAAIATLLGYVVILSLYMILSQKFYKIPYRVLPVSIYVISIYFILRVGTLFDDITLYNIIIKILLVLLLVITGFLSKLVNLKEVLSLIKKKVNK